MSENVLEISNLTKYYGKIKGVENLSLQIRKGEVFGFIGPNGAGKSTTIRSIMNLINKTEGKVFVNGQEFTKNRIDLKNKIGYLPSEIHLYDDLTVKGMLDYASSFYKQDVTKRRKELVELLQLDETKKVEDLSLGNLKKLGIVLALIHEPEILILDEPTSGLDPIMQNVFYEILLKEKQKGTTILYSTHILSEISKICDDVGIIKKGHLIKVENVNDFHKKDLVFVTITSQELKKIVQDIEIKPTFEKENTIKFAYQNSEDELIKKLSHYTIEKILVEEATLEDIFLHYYE